MTCSHDVSAGTACTVGHALGTYEYTTANVTTAQNGRLACAATTNATSVNATSDNSTNATLTNVAPTCPPTSKQSELVALGAGLGAGLGVPLMVLIAVLIYCCGLRRQEKKLHPSGNSVMGPPPRWTQNFPHPTELHAQAPQPSELMERWKERSELSGS